MAPRLLGVLRIDLQRRAAPFDMQAGAGVAIKYEADCVTDYKHLQEHLQTESKNIVKYQEQHSSKDGLGANALINCIQ